MRDTRIVNLNLNKPTYHGVHAVSSDQGDGENGHFCAEDVEEAAQLAQCMFPPCVSVRDVSVSATVSDCQPPFNIDFIQSC